MADWGKIRSRGNVEDRRGSRMMALGGGGLGVAGVIIVIVFNLLGGGNVGDVLNQLQQVQVPTQQNLSTTEFEGADSYEVFASTVLGSTNDMWRDVFEKSNSSYTPPKLVLFREATQSGCGMATSSVGPHYCPVDGTIYIDETFFNELKLRFKAKGGDVAEAYVIAHEVGHHVQHELGIMDAVQKDNSRENSINLELQADCFAGLWAYSIKDQGVLAFDEIQEAIDAAAAVGDDRIQEAVTGQVNKETWTHGSSAQRMEWFTKGYESGTVSACDTF